MQNVPLQNLPNQELSIPLDNNQWDISLRSANGTIAATFTLNGIVLIENVRVVAGMRMLPYKYLENGNFALITQSFEIPDYTKFGITQSLLYFSQDELNAVRNFNPVIITANDFDPNAGSLPLRFAPQGYILA